MSMLSDQVREYARAGFSGIWIQTFEPEEAMGEIKALCREMSARTASGTTPPPWKLCDWDAARGLCLDSIPQPRRDGQPVDPTYDVAGADPLTPIQAIQNIATPAFTAAGGTVLMVLRNYHRYLGNGGTKAGSAQIVQAVVNAIEFGRPAGAFLVVLSPLVELPPEVEKLFIVIHHPLPTRAQLETIGRELETAAAWPTGDAETAVLDAATGLTRVEAENAYALSIARYGHVSPEPLWELKTQSLRKSGLLGLYRGSEKFDTIGGLDAMKQFALKSLRHDRPRDVRPLGIMIIGAPGTGKSMWAKALGAEVNRPCLTLEIGNLMGSLVGQTEANVRQALDTVDAMAPCVLFCDEIEKGLAGSTSGHQGDSGVGARVLGKFLTWLNDHTSDVYCVMTANNLQQLLAGAPEFARAERFDALFFVDLPGPAERDAIWRIYLGQYGLDADQPRPPDAGWTGAEIKACCRLATLHGSTVAEAAINVVPVSETSGELLDFRRQWASGRCLDAARGGRYQPGTAGPDPELPPATAKRKAR